MKSTTIPKGYRLTVTTWENDGDNYNTKTKEGLSKEETKFLVELISLLKSRHGPGEHFGNMYEPDDTEIAEFMKAVTAVVAKHDVKSFSFANYLEVQEDDEEDYHDGVTELLYDLSLSGGEFYTRVMDSYKVEFIPEEIKIQDVTSKFKS